MFLDVAQAGWFALLLVAVLMFSFLWLVVKLHDAAFDLTAPAIEVLGMDDNDARYLVIYGEFPKLSVPLDYEEAVSRFESFPDARYVVRIERSR